MNFKPAAAFRTMALQLQGGLGFREAWELGRLCGALAARWGCDVVGLAEVGLEPQEAAIFGRAVRPFGYRALVHTVGARRNGVGLLARVEWNPELIRRDDQGRALLVKLHYQTDRLPIPVLGMPLYGVSP